MKIDAINFGAFSEPLPVKQVVTEETGSSPIPNDYDDTRLAVNKKESPVSAPIEKSNGTVEDLIQAQATTEQMARSYGFANIAEAQSVTNSMSSGASPSVGGVGSVSSDGISA